MGIPLGECFAMAVLRPHAAPCQVPGHPRQVGFSTRARKVFAFVPHAL